MQIWPLKTCNQDISKSFIARNFKFGQLIQDEGLYSYLVLKKSTIDPYGQAFGEWSGSQVKKFKLRSDFL